MTTKERVFFDANVLEYAYMGDFRIDETVLTDIDVLHYAIRGAE